MRATIDPKGLEQSTHLHAQFRLIDVSTKPSARIVWDSDSYMNLHVLSNQMDLIELAL